MAAALPCFDDLNATPQVEWLACRRSGDTTFIFERDGAILSVVDFVDAPFDLPNLVALFIEAADEDYQSVRDVWAAAMPQSGTIIRPVKDFAAETLRVAAIESLAEGLIVQRTFAGRTALEQAAYRQEFDRLQRVFARLEHYVAQQGLLRPEESFECAAGGVKRTIAAASLPLAAAGRSIHQALPVNSFGVCGLALDLCAKPDGAAEPLEVKLLAIETGKVLAEWSIEAAAIKLGWIYLALDQAIDEPALSLVMEITLPAEHSAWELALGPPLPHPEFRAGALGGGLLEAPLAFRVYATLPGVRVPSPVGAIRPRGARGSPIQFIPYEVYKSVTQVSHFAGSDDAKFVSFDPLLGCITVHPKQGSWATVARLDVTAPPEARRVTARIHLAHETANPTEFAILICTMTTRKADIAEITKLTRASAGFSGWKLLPPLETGILSAFLPASHEGGLTLYLLTRQAPDVADHFAWARFEKLAFERPPVDLAQADAELD